MKTIVFSVRNVPEDLNRRLKAEAALRGMTLEKFFVEFVKAGLERHLPPVIIERLKK